MMISPDDLKIRWANADELELVLDIVSQAAAWLVSKGMLRITWSDPYWLEDLGRAGYVAALYEMSLRSPGRGQVDSPTALTKPGSV